MQMDVHCKWLTVLCFQRGEKSNGPNLLFGRLQFCSIINPVLESGIWEELEVRNP